MGNGTDIETLRHEVSVAVAEAREAKGLAQQVARDFEVYHRQQVKQTETLDRVAAGQHDMTVKVAEVATSLKHVQEQLSTKVSEAGVSAEVARAERDKAERAANSTLLPRALSIIALLVALVAGLLGLDLGGASAGLVGGS